MAQAELLIIWVTTHHSPYYILAAYTFGLSTQSCRTSPLLRVEVDVSEIVIWASFRQASCSFELIAPSVRRPTNIGILQISEAVCYRILYLVTKLGCKFIQRIVS